MKIIKYQIVTEENRGTEEAPQIEKVVTEMMISWSISNEELAKREAYNGEYTIEDDGEPEPETKPSTDEVLNALLGVSE